MTAAKKDSLNAIVVAIGDNKRFSPSDKKRFAQALIDQLDSAISSGKERAALPVTINRLSIAVSKTEKAIIDLKKLIGESSEGFFCDGIARNSVDHRLKAKFGLGDMLYYLEVFNEFLGRPHKPIRKRGPNNIAQLYVAEMVAIKYKQFFKVDPTHNRDSIKPPLPYDRICNVIQDHWKFKIPDSTREAAIVTARAYRVELHDELI